MSFSKSVVEEAWKRSQGRCECERKSCGHSERCPQILKWEQRGNDDSPYGWEAHHITAQAKGGEDILSNCQILCIDCHKNTRSYGAN